MIIGRVTKIDGVRVAATFYTRMQPYLIERGNVVSSPRINSFVKTSVGLDTVICQIVGEHEAEYDKRSNLGRSDSVAPTGPFIVDLEVRGYISDGVFQGGLRCLPLVGAAIETLEDDSLEHLYSIPSAKPLLIGHSLFDESQSVLLDANKLMASHIGIFGNTGSGKSNTLASIIRSFVGFLPANNDKAHILIFDLNNEYGGDAIVNADKKEVYCLGSETNDVRIPLNLDSLNADNWGTMLRASQKTQMPIIRRAYFKWCRCDGNDYVNELKRAIVNKRSLTVFTLREYCSNYIMGIEDLCYNSTSQAFYYPSDNHFEKDKYINTESDIKEISLKREIDKFHKFYLWLAFEVAQAAESGTNFEYVQPLLARARSVISDLDNVFVDTPEKGLGTIFQNRNVAVIQLGDTGTAIRQMLPSLLSELILRDAIASKGNKSPQKMTTIVIDEAHNLLSYDSTRSDLLHDNTLRVFEKIIKEGRKFGVFLCLASQRPSDISSTITSQIHNYFIHRLVNPNGIDRIRRTVSFMGESSLSMLSMLGQGECIISGSSLYMPQYVYINQLDKTARPNSNDIILFGEDGILN